MKKKKIKGIAVESTNILRGADAGANLTTGHHNIILGKLAGANLTTGHHNILVGDNEGGDLTAESFVFRIKGSVIQMTEEDYDRIKKIILKDLDR